MDLQGRHTLPNQELEALLGLRYTVVQNPSWDDTYEDFSCEGSDQFEHVESATNVFIVRGSVGGQLFRVEVEEKTNELGTSYCVVAEPWEGHAEYSRKQEQLRQEQQERRRAAQEQSEREAKQILQLGVAAELMERVFCWQGRDHWKFATSYRLFAADPSAVLTVRVATTPEDGGLRLSFTNLSGAELHNEQARPGEVLRAGLYRDLAEAAAVPERRLKVAAADGRLLAGPAEGGSVPWSEWLQGCDASGQDDLRELVNSRAMECLAKERAAARGLLIPWERVEVASAAVGLQEACRRAGFFGNSREPPELAARVAEALGGAREVSVEASFAATVPGRYAFHGIVLGDGHEGKVLMELTIMEERLPC